MFCRLFVLAFCLAFVPLAVAQQQPAQTPLMGSEASPDVPASFSTDASGSGSADGVFRILVVGDALAGGLGAGMSRMVQDDVRYEILNRFNESSGLARVEVYDWSSAIAKIVAEKPVDALVVLVGVNDRQEVREGNIRHVFKSPTWVKGYTAHVDRLLEAAVAANAKIYWISIPPMANTEFDADMRFLSDIHQQRVVAKSGIFVDVRPFFLTPDGRYTDRGPDETGVERKLRARDGVAFFKQGNNRFGQLVMDVIKMQDTKQPTATAPVVSAAPVANTSSAAVSQVPSGRTSVTQPPMFGQDGLDGEQITFRADIVTPGGLSFQRSVDQKSVLPADAGLPAMRLSAKSGTLSERLMRDGIFAAAPTGRFDDFSEPLAPVAQ